MTEIARRDLSVGIDTWRRRHNGLSADHLNSYNRMTSGELLRITYDMFMGSHFFVRIVATCIQRFPDLYEEDFRQPCRDYFTVLFPDHRDWMPDNVYNFSEVRDQYGNRVTGIPDAGRHGDHN